MTRYAPAHPYSVCPGDDVDVADERPAPVWAAGVATGGKVTIRAQAAPLTYMDRIGRAVADMRAIARKMATAHVGNSSTKWVSFADDEGDETNLHVFRIRLEGVSAATRGDVEDALLDYLADHQDGDVRHGISVEVC